jgi:hypothetical protein
MRDGDRGLIVHCHAGCSREEIMAELARRGLVDIQRYFNRRRRPKRHQPKILAGKLVEQASDDDAERLAIARSIWTASQDIRGSFVASYLAGRGITVEPPPSLRWAGFLRGPDGLAGPAMVALVEHVERGVVGVQRTWLRVDRAAGGWVRLDPASLGPVGDDG